MWSNDYNERDALFSEVLKILTDAGRSGLINPLCDRMDRCSGDKVAEFNTLCRKLIRRYERRSR